MKLKSRKKILFVASLPPPMGGVEHAMQQLLGSSLTQRFEIIHIDSRIRLANVKRGYINLSGIKKLLTICFKIIVKVIATRPKIVYFPISSNKTGFARDGILIFLTKILGLKIVAHYRGGNFDNFYNYSSWIGKALIRFVLICVDKLIVLGESIKRTFRGIYPEKKEIKIVPNGINLKAFSHCPTSRNFNAESPFIILYIGNISFVKGFYDLMLVYKKLFNKYSNLQLVYAGEIISVDQEKNILQRYFSNEIQKRMNGSSKEISKFLQESAKYNAKYLGTINSKRKMKILSEATVFVLPSYSEGFSMGALEAMAAGLPVITTNVGAMREVIKHSENGYTIEPGDCEALFRKLSIIMKDRELCKRMGQKSFEIAKKHFDIEQVAKRLGDIFDTVIYNASLHSAKKL